MSTDLTKRISAAIFDSDLIASRIVLAIAEFLWAVMLWAAVQNGGRK